MDGITEPLAENPYRASTSADLAPRTSVWGWLLRESPHIAMLALAIIGVSFPVPVTYWLVITPVFAVISIASGWRHFGTAQDHVRMVALQFLSWSALVLAIYALYNDGSEGVLNSNALSLAMITILALGTFLAGLHAHSWRTCVVGIILFVAVPMLGWMDQWSILLLIASVAIVGIAAGTWFLIDRRRSTL
jgi:hypothetical protein